MGKSAFLHFALLCCFYFIFHISLDDLYYAENIYLIKYIVLSCPDGLHQCHTAFKGVSFIDTLF